MSTDGNAALGAAIRSARGRLGWTQTRMAAALGVSRPTLCNMEAGRHKVDVARLARLARLTNGALWDDDGLRAAFALDGDPDAPPAPTERALRAVARERRYQDRRRGRQRHRWAEWIAVLGEGFGEACRAAVKLTWHDAGAGQVGIQDRAALRAELVRVAAVAVAIVEHLDEELAGLFHEIGAIDLDDDEADDATEGDEA